MKYNDILDYDWNYDSLPKRMPLCQRAKIFLPFSALTGYEEALEEIQRLEIAEVEGSYPLEQIPEQFPLDNSY